jgi:hypothetical protein
MVGPTAFPRVEYPSCTGFGSPRARATSIGEAIDGNPQCAHFELSRSFPRSQTLQLQAYPGAFMSNDLVERPATTALSHRPAH